MLKLVEPEPRMASGGQFLAGQKCETAPIPSGNRTVHQIWGEQISGWGGVVRGFDGIDRPWRPCRGSKILDPAPGLGETKL